MFPAKCPICGEEADTLVSSVMPDGRVWTWHEREWCGKGSLAHCGPFEMKPVVLSTTFDEETIAHDG